MQYVVCNTVYMIQSMLVHNRIKQCHKLGVLKSESKQADRQSEQGLKNYCLKITSASTLTISLDFFSVKKQLPPENTLPCGHSTLSINSIPLLTVSFRATRLCAHSTIKCLKCLIKSLYPVGSLATDPPLLSYVHAYLLYMLNRWNNSVSS